MNDVACNLSHDMLPCQERRGNVVGKSHRLKAGDKGVFARVCEGG